MVTPHAGTPITTGFKLEGSQAIWNTGNGVEFNSVIASDVSIKSTDIAANIGNGLAVLGGDFHDFKIQNSKLGEVRDTMGTLVFAGNGGSGVLGSGYNLHRAGLSRLVLQREWHRQ